MAYEAPETRYATLAGDRIAYQVFGQGPVDVVYVSPVGECIDLRWDFPPYASFLRGLAGAARVVTFDVRGSGASDHPSDQHLPAWERWADEVGAVLDVVGSERAVIFGGVNAGPSAVLFAATHPHRTRALILANTTARFAAAPDYPQGIPEELLAKSQEFIDAVWGTEGIADFSPDLGGDPAFRHWVARNQRLSLTPADASALTSEAQLLDVRDTLRLVSVPTLVVHREGFQSVGPDHGRFLAEHIPGARLVIVPGKDGTVFSPPQEPILAAIDEFLRSLAQPATPDRALAAVLFTDIVESTAHAVALGDRQWRTLLETHDAVTRALVEQHGGRLVKTTGDGLLAAFDGPGRAIAAATAMCAALRPLGIEIRAGLHAGEVEMVGDDIAGIGVHIAARVLGCAAPGEVWVSATIPMLVTGSGLEFHDRGERELKGVPGTWHLYAVAA